MVDINKILSIFGVIIRKVSHDLKEFTIQDDEYYIAELMNNPGDRVKILGAINGLKEETVEIKLHNNRKIWISR